MNKKTIILIIIGFILTILITIGITLIVTKSKETDKLNEVKVTESKKENTKSNNEEYIKSEEVEENKTNEKDENKTTVIEDKTTVTEDNSISSNNQASNKNNESQTTTQTTPAVSQKSETDIISYVEGIETTSASDKLKSGFVTVVDFIFYGGKIYGKTFSELSNSAKVKIIALALKIDSKIDEYFPGYKETITNTTNKVYTSIKTKLVTLYLDTTVKVCNENPTTCEDAKQGLVELKTNFGITWEFIKDISGIGITKLKDWYEVWKEE